jgi:hypothetical protein
LHFGSVGLHSVSALNRTSCEETNYKAGSDKKRLCDTEIVCWQQPVQRDCKGNSHDDAHNRAQYDEGLFEECKEFRHEGGSLSAA